MDQVTPVAPTQERYSTVAIALHWAIAVFVICNIFLGLSFANAQGMTKFNLLQLHKSVGFTVLGLIILRLAWRLRRSPPPLKEGIRRWEKRAATAVHWAFYVILFVMPITGWIIVSASPTNIPTLLYKTVPVPYLGPVHALPMETRKAVETNVGHFHGALALLTMLLIALHVAAALKHQLWDKDGGLFRMAPLPALRRRR